MPFMPVPSPHEPADSCARKSEPAPAVAAQQVRLCRCKQPHLCIHRYPRLQLLAQRSLLVYHRRSSDRADAITLADLLGWKAAQKIGLEMPAEPQPAIRCFKLGHFEITIMMDSKVIREGLTPSHGVRRWPAKSTPW